MAFDTNVAGPSPVALDIKPPAYESPLETAAKFQEMKLRNTAMQTAAIENQQRQIDLQDQQIGSQALQESAGDPQKYLMMLRQRGASPKAYFAANQAVLGAQKQALELDDLTRENLQKRHDKFVGDLNALEGLPDEQKPARWDSLLQTAHKNGEITDAELADTLQRYPQYPGSDIVNKAIIPQLQMGSQILKNAQTQSETIKNTAQANEAVKGAALKEAETPGATAESQKKELITKAMKDELANPGRGEATIDAAIPPSMDPQINASYKAAYRAAVASGDPQAPAHIVAAAAGHASQIALANNPQVRAGKVAEEVAKEKATGPLKVQQAISIETATNPLKLAQARAVAGATAGVREAQKLDQDYVKAAGATEEMGKVLDLADSKNKAAASALSTVGAVSFNAVNGLRRLNRNEITGLGGEAAGNAYDRVVGFFGSAVTGQKIPQNIRDDIRNLHQTIGENAYHTYTTGLDSLSKRTGTEYAPTVQAPNIRKGAAGGPAVGAVEQGYRFKGGDPAKQENWEKVP